MKTDWYKGVNPNLERLAGILGMAKPSHGYTVAEKSPEVVTAPGVYFPAEKGEVIPLEGRQAGGGVTPALLEAANPSGTSNIPEFNSEQAKMGILEKAIKSMTDVIKSVTSAWETPKEGTPKLEGTAMGQRRNPEQGPGFWQADIGMTPTTSGPQPAETKPVENKTPLDTVNSYLKQLTTMFSRAEGGAVTPPDEMEELRRRIRLGLPNPEGDIAAERNLTPTVTPESLELAAREKWGKTPYSEALAKAQETTPGAIAVKPGFETSYYEAHPEEARAQEIYDLLRPAGPSSYEAGVEKFRESNLMDIAKERPGRFEKPTPASVGAPALMAGMAKSREEQEAMAKEAATKAYEPALKGRGALPAGLTPHTSEDKYALSFYGVPYRQLDETKRAVVDAKLVKPASTEVGLIRGDLKTRLGREPTDAEILTEQDKRKLGGITPISPEVASQITPKGMKNEAALEGLSEDQKGVVRGLTSYKYPWPGSFAMRDPKWQALLGRAVKYDPDFSEAEYQVRYNLRKSFTSGKEKDNILALNTATGHINSLVNASKDLANSNWVTGNAAVNLLAKYFPVSEDLVKRQGKVTSIQTKFNAVADEMAGIFKRTGATDAAIKAWRNTVENPATATPEMWNGFIGGALELMGSRIGALRDIYEAGMGRWKDFPILSATSRKILGGMGLNVDEIDRMAGETPTGKVETPTGKPSVTKDIKSMSNEELLEELEK
jgi:hypothetical protein